MMRRFLLTILLALTPALAMAQDAPDSPAEAISDEIFGPRAPTDFAFGAFQRGYFLTALELALPRAEQGDAAAQTLIAELYAKGLGVSQNDQRAAGWYQLASNNGDYLATFALALAYQDGIGVPKNRDRAAELFGKGRRGRLCSGQIQHGPAACRRRLCLAQPGDGRRADEGSRRRRIARGAV